MVGPGRRRARASQQLMQSSRHCVGRGQQCRPLQPSFSPACRNFPRAGAVSPSPPCPVGAPPLPVLNWCRENGP